ncbi:hypothetical protein CY35_02G203500, partial [Sphagnum magellanicum]
MIDKLYGEQQSRDTTSFKDNSTITLVEKVIGRIPRLDPLDKFKRYTGGFNVTNVHYWSSVAFTGIWAYTMAIVCLLCGVLLLVWQTYTSNDNSFKEEVLLPESKAGHRVPVCCILQFGVLVLAASTVIFWGNVRLGEELKATASTLVMSVDKVKLQVDGAIDLIPLANIGPIANQEIAKKFLSACNNLATTFQELMSKVKLNKAHIYHLFFSVCYMTYQSCFLLQKVASSGTAAGWAAIVVLVASWMVSGVTFVLASVAIDSCQAMEAYDQNPHNSSIARLLPCLTPLAGAEALSGAKKAIKTVIKRSNNAVDLLNHQEERMAASGDIDHPTFLPHVCDPFGPEPELLPRECSSAEGSFANFEDDYGKYRCESDDIEACLATPTPIPNFAYMEAMQAMNATKDVYTTLPTVFRVITCNFVKVTFEDILEHHCAPLKVALTVLWIAFIIASMALMPLLVLWIVHGKKVSDNRV